MDVTLIPCGPDGWARLVAIVDCHDRQCIGYEFPLRGKAKEAERTLEAACLGRFGALYPRGPTPLLRSDNGLVFLEEGRRMAGDYGRLCRSAGLSLVETAQAFMRVRRSIMDSVYEAGTLAGSPDAETWRLYDRMNHFLDSMLLATMEAYERL